LIALIINALIRGRQSMLSFVSLYRTSILADGRRR